MDSKITINIVEPGSGPTPDPVVPNTGLFTHGIGGPEATIITAVSTVLLLTIAAVVVAMLYKKHKKQGKATKLVSTVDACATVVKSKKRVSAGFAAVALLVSAGTFAALLVNAGKSNANAAEGEDGLTLDVSSEELTIEVGDEPVFAVLPVELTVEEATQAGYTLTAHTDNTDLVSTTDSSKVIPMVAADEGELTTLTDNTYGLALAQLETKDDEVYAALSTDSSTPTILKATDYVETEANDTTTIYYGFYITPDVPYGTYTGTNINYNVEPHYITNLSFNGNDNDGGVDMEGMTIIAGDTITLPENTYTKEGYSFAGWNTSAEGQGESYTDEAEYTAIEGESADVTLYAQWKKNASFMQDVATWGSTLSISDETIAVDSRDGKKYYVARLADNNIWMTQNLDFDIVNGGAGLDSTNTDVPEDWADAGNLTNTHKDATWNSTYTTPESYDPGNLYWNGALIYDQTTCEANGGTWQPWLVCENANTMLSTGDSHYHVGNYYNWTAAVAMSDSSSYTSSSTDVDQSICPAGWRLPTYSGDKSYESLVSAQSLTAGTGGNVQNSPTYFVYGGEWIGSSTYVSNKGKYWSSVFRNNDYSNLLAFSVGGELNSQSYDRRFYGFSLRCVAR